MSAHKLEAILVSGLLGGLICALCAAAIEDMALAAVWAYRLGVLVGMLIAATGAFIGWLMTRKGDR